MRRTFSLIELITALAIVAVLTALAVPAWAQMQAEARLTEGRVNYNQLVDQLHVQWADDPPAAGFYTGMNPSLSTLGRDARPWNTGNAAFAKLGWRPDGDIRCSYGTDYYFGGTQASHVYTVCNVDGNGEILDLQGHEDFSKPLTDPSRFLVHWSCRWGSTIYRTGTVPGSMNWTEAAGTSCS